MTNTNILIEKVVAERDLNQTLVSFDRINDVNNQSQPGMLVEEEQYVCILLIF